MRRKRRKEEEEEGEEKEGKECDDTFEKRKALRESFEGRARTPPDFL